VVLHVSRDEFLLDPLVDFHAILRAFLDPFAVFGLSLAKTFRCFLYQRRGTSFINFEVFLA
jgi:hypothetical protein